MMYELTGEVSLYPGKGGWHFVTLPTELADELRVRYADTHQAFGSLRVRASLGSSRRSTSLFSDTRSSSYLLPVKAEVRRRERIEDGDTATIVERRIKGTEAWTRIRTGTEGTGSEWIAAKRKIFYEVRARLRRGDVASGWSPVAEVRVP